jgi:glycosyltransferase involved in cell wall biosynthesis
MIWRLYHLFKELKPDIVHTHQIGPLFYAGPAARAAGAPLVVHTEHGKHYTVRRRTRWLGWLAGRYAARFFCVSDDIAAEVRKHRIVPAEKVHVVYNGINAERFRGRGGAEGVRQTLGIPPGVPVLGTIGRLTEVKRQDLLIHAFSQVRRHVPDAHLVLVGDGPLRTDLDQLVARLGLEGAVHFAGYQADPERYLSVMDAFVLTSRSEGMPLVILEAWAAGVPVVASAVGGVPAMIDPGRTGLLFPSGDEAALTAALVRILTDQPARRRLSEEGEREVTARYDTRRMAEDYQRHYAACS